MKTLDVHNRGVFNKSKDLRKSVKKPNLGDYAFVLNYRGKNVLFCCSEQFKWNSIK